MSKIVNRTLDFFELFAQERRPLSLTDIMKRLDTPMSSCHDVVRALEARGYLYEVKARGGYYPTARFYQLGKLIMAHDPVAARAEAVLQALSDQIGASVSLSRIKGVQCTYLLVCSPPDPLRFMVVAGDNVRNLYATSAGKAALATLPLAQRRELLEQTPLTPLTPHTKTDVEAVLADVAEGEARGWFINREESVEDALTISARFVRNDVSYVVTASGTLRRMERRLDEAVHALLGVTQQLAGD